MTRLATPANERWAPRPGAASGLAPAANRHPLDLRAQKRRQPVWGEGFADSRLVRTVARGPCHTSADESAGALSSRKNQSIRKQRG